MFVAIISKHKIKIKLIISVLLLILTFFLARIIILLSEDTFYKGVLVEGIDVSGLSKSQARELVAKKLNRIIIENSILLNYEDRTWTLGLRDISYGFLLDEAIEKAYALGREGNFLKRLKTIRELKSNKKNMQAGASFSKPQLEAYITGIKYQIDKKEKNASAMYKDGNILFEKEVIGRIMNVDNNVNLLENKLLGRDFSPFSLEVRWIYPKILYDDISGIEEVVTSFSTGFNSANVNRTHNIKLACERINNKILLPDEIFSMDASLGTRTKENGYKDAPVIVKGKLIEGVGGGVCQVTTTLYVAVLEAKLEIVERVNHSIPLGYVAAGQDATISEGYIDFKFINNKDYPFLISASVEGSRVVIRLLGKRDAARNKVKLRSVITEYLNPPKDEIIIDDTLPAGTAEVERKPVRGLKVVVFRETYDENNRLIEKEKISEDVYQPVRGRIRVSSDYSAQNTD
ncbi:MAG: vanomycin resistance protein VanB [Clostridium sp.]|nr:vanomycin resistance protein VanB [Clostridium sp.]